MPAYVAAIFWSSALASMGDIVGGRGGRRIIEDRRPPPGLPLPEPETGKRATGDGRRALTEEQGTGDRRPATGWACPDLVDRLLVQGCSLSFVLHRAEIAKGGVEASSVVEALDVLEEGGAGGVVGGE